MVYAFAVPLGEGTNNQAIVINPPWRIHKYIQELLILAKQCVSFQCVHTYREANGTTDLLAKHSHNKTLYKFTTLIINYLRQLKEAIYWRNWEFKISDVRS
ncbi:hypothetical protein H5410_056721 [Solanum commersonii]|uniref:RNase H type-1 domain-containing protein n=1 Tax=Solanum commersonii TaxID=4109 RepID=A0A9J5WL19_SOLCO|nr:hypothetical protein H5410_056721 [Solanum commersonii]